MSVVPTGAERSEAKWRDLLSMGKTMPVEARPLGYARGDE
jgi:hypothetical protein